MAAVIHSVINFVRAETVLEIGVGFTTPWILKALKGRFSSIAITPDVPVFQDNKDEVERDRDILDAMQVHRSAQVNV